MSYRERLKLSCQSCGHVYGNHDSVSGKCCAFIVIQHLQTKSFCPCKEYKEKKWPRTCG